MNANIQGALYQINKSWKAFEHKGKPMTKAQVKAVLTYGISKGYISTDDFSDFEIDEILKSITQ